ncbi:hypothetical protein CC1G_00358 [Coprinopsis cinerea okayama7|uniref:Uncharacterized protein n=1 Tax=Coprinopsis cinerea (strain Okayama-7 / 130 / ATCC MYA-4618 / FGSC 9003) TaxID=240176 RepID=A8NXN8_COPC7|nr:hypothetical protein CC1G_00358 [Coprinopsis cinerea okayama7\|eukprot:XP_001837222.1 hypothetical protein CC1G_00358 [Coprinopsis cinerea okayama7\
MPDPVPPEPYHFAQQESSGELAGKDPNEASESKQGEPPAKHTTSKSTPNRDKGNNRGEDEDPFNEAPPKANWQNGNESGVDSGSESSSESSDDLNHDEIERLMRENSDLSSSDEEQEEEQNQDGTVEKDKRGKRGKSRSMRLQNLYGSPANTIAVLVLACWTLRVPLAYRDLSRIIESYELPYLDPVRFLPQSMVQHLTKHRQQALSPHHAPSTLLLHSLASRLAEKLHRTYSINIPEINAAPLLWRVVRALGGTPTLYALSKRISSILSFPLTLRPSLTSGLAKNKAYDPGSHQYDNAPPEVSMMASCVIALKMVYGLDGTERLPRDAADPACALPSRDAFFGLLRNMVEEDAKVLESVFSAESSIPIQWCLDVLDSYFPLTPDQVSVHAPAADEERKEKTSATLAAIRLQEENGGGDRLRPGEKYKIWNARDVLGTVPEDYAFVLSRAAGWVGTREEYLERVIETYEKRVFRWHEKMQRKPRGEGEVSENEEGRENKG